MNYERNDLFTMKCFQLLLSCRFIVQDNVLGAERLLIALPLPPSCPISPSQTTRLTLLEIFRGLQHPYIHPVLDVEFWDKNAGIITPLNPAGSLKDLIYDSVWHDEYGPKYNKRGNGLPLGTVSINQYPKSFYKYKYINNNIHILNLLTKIII